MVTASSLRKGVIAIAHPLEPSEAAAIKEWHVVSKTILPKLKPEGIANLVGVLDGSAMHLKPKSGDKGPR